MHCRQLANSKSGNAQNNSGESYIICCETQSTHELGQTLAADSRLADPLMGVGETKFFFKKLANARRCADGRLVCLMLATGLALTGEDACTVV